MHDQDYLKVLEALKELPFNVGAGTLIDLVTGAVTQKMVTNHTYMELDSYGCLEGRPKQEVRSWIQRLKSAGCITQTSPPGTHYKLLEITGKGLSELKEPKLLKARPQVKSDETSDATEKLIEQFGFFLEGMTPAQKQAIACPDERIRCIAGAGTGKTTVLTKRVQFLAKYRGVPADRILAVTFTRKARKEMQERLEGIPANVVTFNGFCHRLLKQHGADKPVISYGQKRRLFQQALEEEGIILGELISDYYTKGQRQRSTQDELARQLMRDVYGLIDHFANEDEKIPQSNGTRLANILLSIATRINERMEERGVTDYSGQLRDALALLRKSPDSIPEYEHVLVDEYQDVNEAQRKLLELLDPQSLFVVGDPRQSIYGWRGSRIEHIMEFKADTTVQLRENHRSAQAIITAANQTIKPMGLPDLKGSRNEEGVVQVLKYGSEQEELSAVASLCAGLTAEAFVLARTNSQLQDLSSLLKRRGVNHRIRREEDEEEARGLTLATVHAIKGLEASTVIVMGAADRYFPIKASDHPVVDIITAKDLDKDAEERRLLYVALTRAKDTLLITHNGTPSRFLSVEDEAQKRLVSRDDGAYERLKAWRSQLAKQKNLPAYCILSDKTLRQIADSKPDSPPALQDVHGMGPVKVEQYGEELLQIIRNA